MAFTHLWVGAFTRDAGLALFDPIYRRFPFLAPYPKTIEVEITTRCHLKCTICEHTYWNEPSRDMTFDEFKHIVDQFPHLKWIGLTGIGTSFINPAFVKMLEYVKSRNVFVEFFDTFDLIDGELAEKIVELKIDKTWVSMEGATKQTYEKIRVGAKFEKTLSNVRGLLEAKRKRKSPLPELWFHYIINKYNVSEMPAYVDLVHEIIKDGNDYATLIFFTNLLSFPEVKDLIPVIPEEISRNVREKAANYGIYLNWNENIACSEPIQKCTKWTEPFVLVTGHVQPCCVINMANDREFQKKYAFGNLLTQDFHDIWKSPELAEFLNKLYSGKLPLVCKNCRVYKITS
ncbi:MAG: radical SAM protein [Elusimicrobiota bacterium]